MLLVVDACLVIICGNILKLVSLLLVHTSAVHVVELICGDRKRRESNVQQLEFEF